MEMKYIDNQCISLVEEHPAIIYILWNDVMDVWNGIMIMMMNDNKSSIRKWSTGLIFNSNKYFRVMSCIIEHCKSDVALTLTLKITFKRVIKYCH